MGAGSAQYERLELALQVGSMMLTNGAETYRVEDTMNRILQLSEERYRDVNTVVLGTGIFVSVTMENGESLSRVRRIRKRELNLHRIHRANQISRVLCAGECSCQEALEQVRLEEKNRLYPRWMMFLATVAVAVCFTPMMGGAGADMVASALVSTCMAALLLLEDHLGFHVFIKNVAAAAVVALVSVLCGQLSPIPLFRESIIISCIMPLVPGTVITNAIRDTMYGDYMTGLSRTMEGFLIAIAIALGVGVGLGIGQLF